MFILALSCLVSAVDLLLQESVGSDFNDLGRQLLGGFALAVVVAIAFTLIKLRMRDKKPPAAFISITAARPEEATSNLKANSKQ